MKIYILFFLIIISFSSCLSTIPTPQDREKTLISLTNSEFSQVNIETSFFRLLSLQKKIKNCTNKDLRIYIEGDGLSWITRKTISSNPTPINPAALKLMNQDSSECKVYIARPCQYVNSTMCEKKYWTGYRFSPEVIESYEESLNYLKTKYMNSSFTFIGYSGGGAIATILASKRSDVNMLITIAGNLDIDKWTTIHNISKLEGSLNPADFTKNLENIKQYHLIGNNDDVIPKDVFLSYFSKFDKKDNVFFRYLEQNHNCCWEKPYKRLLIDIK
jgi:hypothetical protein